LTKGPEKYLALIIRSDISILQGTSCLEHLASMAPPIPKQRFLRLRKQEWRQIILPDLGLRWKEDSIPWHCIGADEQVTYIYMYDGRSTNPIIHEFTSGIIFIAKSYQIYMGRIHRKKAPPPLFSAGSIQCCQERYLPAPIPTTG
jgi:hypothetical protein